MTDTDLYCGMDVGASSTKAALIDSNEKLVSKHVIKSGVDYRESSRQSLEIALEKIGRKQPDVAYCVATGYGRDNVDFGDKKVTEITCHGKGCYFLFPKTSLIIDIGGQDSKVIRLDQKGDRVSFKMNRKCAAGTGAFLEEIAARLDLKLEDLNRLASDADRVFSLGSFCTVFAKTEILAFLRKGERVENILRGAFESVVNRIIEMDRFENADVVLTGGVAAYNPILVEALESRLNKKIYVPEFPQFTGALGAALLAKEAKNLNKD